MIIAERTARLEAEARFANARAEAALIASYKLEIEKLRRQLYGTSSERKARLLEQMELQLEELEASATENELAAETTRPSARCAALRWAGSHGCLPGPSAAPTAPPSWRRRS